MEFGDPQFWIALLQIIGVNIVLSGDNAVVIALAARSLPAKQQKQAVLIGSAAAVVLRIVLTIVAVELLRFPYLKLVGAALLLWIGIQLLVPEEEDHGGGGDRASAGMFVAVRTILIADLVMSLDNVIAVAAAAKGSLVLLVLGLLVSIPLVIFGSTLLMRLMDRWPIIVTIGAALLGWVAGEMAVSDPATQPWIDANAHWLHWALPALGAILVVAMGKTLAARAAKREDEHPAIDLAPADAGPSAAPPSPAAKPLTILLAADDSEAAVRAADALVARLASWYKSPVSLHLLNVQPAAHSDVSAFVGKVEIDDYHREQGMRVLAPIRERLQRAGVAHEIHIGVGEAADVIAHYARELGADQVVIGASTGRTFAGSTALALIPHINVPVTLMK